MPVLPPEIWSTIVRLAAASLPELARLSALTRSTRVLCWTSPQKYRFLITLAATSGQSALDILASDPTVLRNPSLFPDLPELLSLLFSNGGCGHVTTRWCGHDGHNQDKCLLIQICKASEEGWVRECLEIWPIGTGDRSAGSSHFPKAAETLLCRGMIDLLPLLIGDLEGDAALRSINGGVGVVRIVKEAPDPMLILQEVLDRRGCRPGDHAVVHAIGAAARRGMVGIVRWLGARVRLQDVTMWERLWSEVIVGERAVNINVETVEALNELGVRITRVDFLRVMERLHDVLPERIDDDPVLAAIIIHPDTSTQFLPQFAWKLIERPCLLQQLIKRSVVGDNFLDHCLACCHWAGPRASELARKALEAGARVTSIALQDAASSGNVDLMRLLLDAIPDRPSGGNGRVVESMLGSPVLTPEMCDLIVGAGFDVTDQAIMIFARTSRHTLLNDDGAHRVLRAVLDAAMSKRNAILGQSQQSIVLPMMLQQLSSNEASEEWVLRQVEMLVEFGYPATENTVAIAKEQGFVETANFLEWSLKKSLSLGQGW